MQNSWTDIRVVLKPLAEINWLKWWTTVQPRSHQPSEESGDPSHHFISMDTVVKTLWNVKQQSFLKPEILPYRMNRNCVKQTSKFITIKLSRLYIIALIKVEAYRAPVTPVGPHSFPPDHRQWRLYRSTLRCRPTAAPRSAGQPLSATTNTVMSMSHGFQT